MTLRRPHLIRCGRFLFLRCLSKIAQPPILSLSCPATRKCALGLFGDALSPSCLSEKPLSPNAPPAQLKSQQRWVLVGRQKCNADKLHILLHRPPWQAASLTDKWLCRSDTANKLSDHLRNSHRRPWRSFAGYAEGI